MPAQLAYSVAEACAVASIGRTVLYEAINSGELRAVKRGRRTLVLADSLRKFIDGLPAIEPKRARLTSELAGRAMNAETLAGALDDRKKRSWLGPRRLAHKDRTPSLVDPHRTGVKNG